jgi:hypothetical protein
VLARCRGGSLIEHMYTGEPIRGDAWRGGLAAGCRPRMMSAERDGAACGTADG